MIYIKQYNNLPLNLNITATRNKYIIRAVICFTRSRAVIIHMPPSSGWMQHFLSAGKRQSDYTALHDRRRSWPHSAP